MLSRDSSGNFVEMNTTVFGPSIAANEFIMTMSSLTARLVSLAAGAAVAAGMKSLDTGAWPRTDESAFSTLPWSAVRSATTPPSRNVTSATRSRGLSSLMNAAAAAFAKRSSPGFIDVWWNTRMNARPASDGAFDPNGAGTARAGGSDDSGGGVAGTSRTSSSDVI